MHFCSDTFFAAGTLSKYEVIDLSIDAISIEPSTSPNSAQSESQLNEVTKDRTTKKTATEDTTKRKRPLLIDDDSSNDSSETAMSDLEEEKFTAPQKPTGRRRNIIITESDDENDEKMNRGTDARATEDDAYLYEMQKNKGSADVSEDRLPSDINGKANEWFSSLDLERNGGKRGHTHGRDRPKHQKRERIVEKFEHWNEEEEDAHGKNHGEVGQILKKCEQLAKKLRKSILEWSNGQHNNAPNEDHVSLASIDTPNGKSASRIVTQDHIPHISDKLVLKPYQVVGLNWLLLLCENNVSGVLADEMGLGKTVQSISFLLLLHSISTHENKQFDRKEHMEASQGPHLIVVPASVLSNWQREFAWIAPTLRVIIYHGAKEHRLNLQETLTPDQFDIILTTYTYFERDSCQDDRNFIRSFRFGYMILDEGHSIKNSKSSRFKRISTMRSKIRLVLSGTPIQNNLTELLALLSFLMPRMFDCDSDELLSFFDGTEESKCWKIRKILAPFILRREKRLVLNQLVAKKEHTEMVVLGEAQRKRYQQLLESVIKQKKEQATRDIAKKSMKHKKRSKVERQLEMLTELDYSHVKETSSDAAIFTQLRKAANHPILLRNHYASEQVLSKLTQHLYRAEAFGTRCTMEMVRKELETYSDFQIHDLCVHYGANKELKKLQLPIEALLDSAKFQYLDKLLPKLKQEGHRVLIFSQWTKLLDLLEVLMQHRKYRFLRLDGSTMVETRQELIDEYNTDQDIFIFLLSTRAGGLGINLTAADTVILHDLDFNPTNDEQACDRCHRIGQTRPVSIYKLVAENTVDHDIHKLGEVKRQLNHAVLGNLNDEAKAFVSSLKKKGGKSRNGEMKKSSVDSITLEMMLATAISSYGKQ